MKITATTTAAIMIGILLTMPTAVITESSEKTISSRMIWMMIEEKDALALPRAVRSPPRLPAFAVDFMRALPHQEDAADDEDQIASADLIAP